MNHWAGFLLLIVAIGVTPQFGAGQKTEPAEKSQQCTDVYGDPLPKGAVARLGTVRHRHNWYVEAIAFSPDGKVVVSGDIHAARMWDVASGKELRRFEDYSASHQALAFSPDGRLLAGGGRHCVILWEASTGRELRRLKVEASVTSLAFSPNGRQLAATGFYDKAVRLWDVASGKKLRRFADQKGYSRCLTFSPDGTILASATNDGTVHFWDVATGKERSLIPQVFPWSWCVAFSPDGNLLAAAGRLPNPKGRNECAVHLWDLATGKKLPQFGMDERFGWRLAFAPDGKTLGVAGHDAILRLWDVATGKLVRQLDAWPPGVSCGGYFRTLAFSPDGKIVGGPSLHTSVLSLWSTATGKKLYAFAGHDAPVQRIVASPDGKIIASRGDYDKGMHLWEAATGKHLVTLRHQGSRISELAFTPDTRTAITSDAWRDDLRFWQAATGKEMRRIKVRGAKYCVSLAISPDGKILAGGTSRGEVFLWDLSAGKELLRFLAHPPILDEGRIDEYVPVKMLFFSPDGKTILSAPHALSSTLWSVATGAKVRSFRAKGRGLWSASLAFSPDGKTLRALRAVDCKNLHRAADTSVAWEVASGKERREFRTPYIHPGWPGCAAFSPDGQTYAVCTGNSALIQAWNLPCEAETARFEGHLQPVTALTFLPDGRLASASHDTTILIWQAVTSKKTKAAPPSKFSAKQLTAQWTALADADAAKAYQAMQTFVASPRQAVMFLQKKLHPIAPVSPKRLTKLIFDLDSPRFVVRQTAARELEKLGPVAKTALNKARAKRTSLEARLRVELLLDKLVPLVFSREVLRLWRALEVLEHVGTPDARQVLQNIAKGAQGHHFTDEAKEALKRLGR